MKTFNNADKLVISVLLLLISYISYRKIVNNPLCIDVFGFLDNNVNFRNKMYDSRKLLESSEITWGEFLDINKPSLLNRNASLLPNGIITCKSPTLRQRDHKENISSSNCLKEMNKDFIENWRSSLSTEEYCEKGAPSKIRCYVSPNHSKYCVFENAMMNFRKMKKRIHSDGTVQRLWERGFLAADCGYGAKDEIDGYFLQYKPDIEGQNDAICDYSFTEPVVAYSHDNVKHLGHTMNDILNVWSVIWLSKYSAFTKNVTFLNIDGFRRGKVYEDDLSQFTSHYSPFFKQIIGTSQFAKNKKVCFKELLMFPKPMLLFITDRSRHSETSASNCHNIEHVPNPFFQRWNLQFRLALNSLNFKSKSLKVYRITILRKTSQSATPQIGLDAKYYNQSQRFFNELSNSLKEIGKNQLNKFDRTIIEEIDVSTVSLRQQVAVIARSNILVGIHGSGINALSMHMPIGTPDCCAVVEIYHRGTMKQTLPGIRNAAQSMGNNYKGIEVEFQPHQDNEISNTRDGPDQRNKQFKAVVSAIEKIIVETSKTPTCVVQEAFSLE